VADKADIPAVTVNQLRHSCASDLLRAGASLPEVQRMLGHAAIESTVRYAQIADPDRAAAMDKHPINEVLAGERSAP
jgi:site-specific recombinase XerD